VTNESKFCLKGQWRETVKMRRLVALMLFVATTSCFATDPSARTWTDLSGKTLVATFVGIEAGQVSLQTGDAKLIQVPVTSLSAGDRKWVEQQSAAPAGTVGSPGAAAPFETPAALTEWPDRVALGEKAVAEVIREDAEKREFVYESEHYEFVSDSKLSASLVREFSRIFEVTRLANCLFPLDLKPRPESGREKFLARIFTKKADYFEAGGLPGSAGVYIVSEKALMLPLDSLGVKTVGNRISIDYQSQDYRTLIHEITHQMMNHWIWRLPVWYSEGSAEYVELADYSAGRLNFSQQDRLLKEHLMQDTSVFRMLPIEKLMSMSHQQWQGALASGDSSDNYQSALALTFFFYHHDGAGDGKNLIAWLKELGTIRTYGAADRASITENALKTHLLRGRSYAELQEEIEKALRKEGIKVEFR